MSTRFSMLAVVVGFFAVATPESLLAQVGQWKGGGPEGAVVEILAVHPSNPSTVYASTVRRLYKSVDAGVSWSPTGLAAGFNIVLPTSNPSIIYAASTYGAGTDFYRSRDGGATWVTTAPVPDRISAITADERDPMSIFASTDNGIFRSTDGGDTWGRLSSPQNVFTVSGIAIDPDNPQILYASLASIVAPGVFRSNDRGQTWSPTALRLASTQLLLVRGPGTAQSLFAFTSEGVKVTTDGGATWQGLLNGLQISQLAVDPTNVDNLYFTYGEGLFRSQDGGRTTSRAPESFGPGLVAIAVSQSPIVLVGSRKGISRSADGSLEFDLSNRGFHELFVQSLAVDPTDPSIVFAAAPGGIRTSRDGGESWEDPVPGDPDAEVVAIDPSNHSTLYAAGSGGIHKSDDSGQNWVSKGSPTGAFAGRIAELLIDPNNSRRLFASYASVHRSLDGAEHWTPVLTPDDDYSSYYYPPIVGSMALAPSNGQVLYAGGDTGFIYRSSDGGDSWTDLKAGIGTNALAVDSCDPGIVLAGTWAAVYRTIDGGVTWSPRPMSYIQPYPPVVWALARDPRHSSTYFAGTSAGLYWTVDRGASWKQFEPTLEVPVRSLALDPSGRFLYAGTEGGVFQLERDFTPCRNGPDRLCLLGGMYQVSLTARNRAGATITGRAIIEGDSFGYFSLPDVTGDPTFPEVFVKMADALFAPPPYGGHAWVFHSSLTDLDYTLTVVETATGRVQRYEAADTRSLTCGKADTAAFDRDCRESVLASSSSPDSIASSPGVGPELSLLGGRFRATVQASDPRTGRVTVGTAIARGDAFGYFSLPAFTGNPSYPEIFVKMADATALPGNSFWVFHTGLTDLDYTLTVTDQVTGAVRTYAGGATDGTSLCGQADTSAFRN